MSCIYVMREGPPGGPIKIGWSVDPDNRRRALQTGNARPIHLLGAVPGGVEVEREAHGILSGARYEGGGTEWFDGGDHTVQRMVRVLLRRSRGWTSPAELRVAWGRAVWWAYAWAVWWIGVGALLTWGMGDQIGTLVVETVYPWAEWLASLGTMRI